MLNKFLLGGIAIAATGYGLKKWLEGPFEETKASKEEEFETQPEQIIDLILKTKLFAEEKLENLVQRANDLKNKCKELLEEPEFKEYYEEHAKEYTKDLDFTNITKNLEELIKADKEFQILSAFNEEKLKNEFQMLSAFNEEKCKDENDPLTELRKDINLEIRRFKNTYLEF
ncbi:hypothetical protein DMB92_04085 [Campylobacter sp. MIT 99-7217]|uniref:hypothetical protein n=1 Tax=Campylobacter sp. MIT 99-7217 TaxID=535091 RepID=UPI001156DF14|nr:hypothetical protein [Campylobacter sp. MIT 99-7217]TQR33144.1 hypothetical protein DMB92_04085 [Campylobacter sp. MIT 99-7217]